MINKIGGREESLRAPFPYFGGKSLAADLIWRRFGDVPCYVARWSGQSQPYGCRPTRLVALLVDHKRLRRVAVEAAIRASLSNHALWRARCSALVTSCRLHRASFNLFSSLWWTLIPIGIFPLAASQTTCDRSCQMFGSPILTKARVSLRLWRVLNRTVPIGYRRSGAMPAVYWPNLFLMGAV